MRTPFAATLLLACAALPVSADEWSEAKAAAKAALKNTDPAARGEAAEGLGAFDRPEAVEYLLDLWAYTTTFVRQLQSEKIEKLDKSDSMPIKKKLQQGKVTLSGPEVEQKAEFEKLEEELKAIEAKMREEERVRGRIRAALNRMRSAEALKILVKRVTSEKDWSTRAAAADALGDSGEAEARGALRDALKKEKDPRAALSLIESLGRLKDAESVPLLGEQLTRAADWQVRSVAVAALRALGDLHAVDALVDALKTVEGRLREEVNAALVALTGVDKHGDHATWKDWWKANRETALAGSYRKPDDEPARGGAETTTFYGIPVVSKRVVFILDRSGSMAEPAGWKPSGTATGPSAPRKPVGDRKIDVAQYEMRNAILGLKSDVRFNVIIYSHEYTLWLAQGLEAAGDASKAKAVDFIDRLTPEGMTNIFDPLEKAFLLTDLKESAKQKGDVETGPFKGGADTVYLMTDGMANEGRIIESAAIVAKVAELNRHRRIIIHTVGVGKDVDSAFLHQLAVDNGGTFVHRK